MTANEMRFNFQLKFDSLFEHSAPAYNDEQISNILTDAELRVFIKRYNPLGNKYKKGFEDDEKRRRDLEQLIKPALYNAVDPTGALLSAGVENITKEVDQDGTHPDGALFGLPDDFLYAIEEAATLRTNVSAGVDPLTSESTVKPVRHDEYLANIKNPYKKPYKDLLWRMDISRLTHAIGSPDASNKRTEIIIPTPDTITYYLDKYRLRYLSMPPAIVVDELDTDNQVHCILDESLHGDIVDEAVVFAQAASQKEAYQVGISEQQRSE